jgi:hypothetical protein
MPITYPNDIADDIRYCQASTIGESHGKPAQRLLLPFGEKVSHNRMEPLPVVLENRDELLVPFRIFGALNFSHAVSKFFDRDVTGVVPVIPVDQSTSSLVINQDGRGLTLRAPPVDILLVTLFVRHIVSNLFPQRE